MEIARFWILVDQLVGQNGTKMIRPDSVGALDPNPTQSDPKRTHMGTAGRESRAACAIRLATVEAANRGGAVPVKWFLPRNCSHICAAVGQLRLPE